MQDLPVQDAALKGELAQLAAEEERLADQVAAFIPLDQLAAKGLDTPASCELAASRQQSRREALEEERDLKLSQVEWQDTEDGGRVVVRLEWRGETLTAQVDL